MKAPPSVLFWWSRGVPLISNIDSASIHNHFFEVSEVNVNFIRASIQTLHCCFVCSIHVLTSSGCVGHLRMMICAFSASGITNTTVSSPKISSQLWWSGTVRVFDTLFLYNGRMLVFILLSFDILPLFQENISQIVPKPDNTTHMLTIC